MSHRITGLRECPKCQALVSLASFGEHFANGCAPPSRIAVKTRSTKKKSKQAKLSRVGALQLEAKENGSRWLRIKCTRCPVLVFIHVDWKNPLIMCEQCRMERRAKIGVKRAATKAANKMRAHMPNSGHSVHGGLPSLGRRR